MKLFVIAKGTKQGTIYFAGVEGRRLSLDALWSNLSCAAMFENRENAELVARQFTGAYVTWKDVIPFITANPLSFAIEMRGTIPVTFWPDESCYPSTETELELWDQLTLAKNKLANARYIAHVVTQALRRDAEEGRTIHGEMAEELAKVFIDEEPTYEEKRRQFEAWHNRVYGPQMKFNPIRSLEHHDADIGLGYVDPTVAAQFFAFCGAKGWPQ